ncbi:MAG: PRC-barrel domain-containing protein [Syntrophaceae bacterium]|nr:PRC-barrel domain-containing protein [Syntrophaceae bacterium]
MLNKAKTLSDYRLDSLDGEIGRVIGFYFDDLHWTIRYLVADPEKWLSDRQVLISPYALFAVNKEQQNIAINLTKKQIEDSPSLNKDQSVSRQFEEAYYGYYEWPMYWTGPLMWGFYPSLERDPKKWQKLPKGEKVWDAHLRSMREVNSYYVQAADGEIGHVEDFIIDDETWAIRYLIVDTKNWWKGKTVLISPRWIERVSWDEAKVFINLSREAVKQSPEYTDESLLTRDFEIRLHGHYTRRGYWDDEPAAKEPSR